MVKTYLNCKKANLVSRIKKLKLLANLYVVLSVVFNIKTSRKIIMQIFWIKYYKKSANFKNILIFLMNFGYDQTLTSSIFSFLILMS